MPDPLGFRRRPEWSCILIALYANCTDVRTTATKVKIPAVPQERIGTDYGLHYRHAVSHFLVVMMYSGQRLRALMSDLSAHPVERASHP
jgi:hypothetical protein